jgi:DNA-binding MarR family transcriptional regulator
VATISAGTTRARRSRPETDASRTAWALLSELMRLQKARHATAAAEVELSPVQGFALCRLEPGTPVAMNELAEMLGCDASNVTGIVDRLEARGLIERRSAAHDRRVKMLSVTPKGTRVRARLADRLSEPLPEIARLSHRDQVALSAILERALGKRP